MFNKQEIILMEGMEDVILLMECHQICNPIENISFDSQSLPHVFQNHTSKYKKIERD